MGPHSLRKQSNKHEVVVALTGTLCSSYSGESIIPWINYNPSYAWLRQAFDRRRIHDCEGFHYIPRCTWWPYCLFRQFIECEQPPQIFVLRSTNFVGWLLLGKKILLLSLSLRCHDTISQIYRCSVVWQHNIRIIILPILFWISCAGKRIILWIRYTKDDELVRN